MATGTQSEEFEPTDTPQLIRPGIELFVTVTVHDLARQCVHRFSPLCECCTNQQLRRYDPSASFGQREPN